MNTIEVSGRPTDKDIEWFIKNVGPRTHWLPKSIGGKGWRFEAGSTGRGRHKPVKWYLTLDDDKMLTYYLLVK